MNNHEGAGTDQFLASVVDDWLVAAGVSGTGVWVAAGWLVPAGISEVALFFLVSFFWVYLSILFYSLYLSFSLILVVNFWSILATTFFWVSIFFSISLMFFWTSLWACFLAFFFSSLSFSLCLLSSYLAYFIASVWRVFILRPSSSSFSESDFSLLSILTKSATFIWKLVAKLLRLCSAFVYSAW